MRKTKLIPAGLLIILVLSISYILMYLSFATTLSSGFFPDNEQHEAIMQYLRGPLFAQENLAFLDQNERSHMVDVKVLFDWAFILFLISAGIMAGILGTLAWQKMNSQLAEILSRSAWWSGWLLLAIVLSVTGMAMLDFSSAFTIFHHLLFPQGGWQFPMNSTLIQLYPQEIFFQFVLYWTAKLISLAALLVLIGWLSLQMLHSEKYFRNLR